MGQDLFQRIELELLHRLVQLEIEFGVPPIKRI